MPNRLAQENSPYLLQHAHNPVDWFPWGAEALEKARAEDKPIFLSVGYAACHWCHVMEHESFENHATAALMNAYFVNIKVDREERPDIDDIYMQAVVAMTHQGGWPMSVFLTPEGQPFYGGTYFPPARRYNMPGFNEVLQTVAQLWQEDRQQLLESAQNISAYLQNNAPQPGTTAPLTPQVTEEAAQLLAQNYDWQNGGWGQAPKFPQPMIIEFLLQRAARSDQTALKISEHALQAMAQGGMYDVVGGGFARYSVDNHWKIPHFEKMLYDNAQLARAYLHAYLLTHNPFYRQVCEATLDFVLRELRHPAGGFFSSLDADSEGVEGKYYLWRWDEIRALGLPRDEEDFFVAVYGITKSGNFEGSHVLQRVLSDEDLAVKFKLQPAEISAKLESIHTRMLAARATRVHPSTDNKVLTAWNALMLTAFAEAGRYLKRQDYLSAAIHNAEFLLDEMHTTRGLLRSWREGKAHLKGYLEDYAALILGLLALYQSGAEPRWYNSAVALAEEMIAHFSDSAGGFFDTGDNHEKLLLRPKETQDNATPSGNALATLALLQLSAYSGKGTWRDLAEEMLAGTAPLMTRYPTGFAQWLCAADFALASVVEVAILGEPDSPEFGALTEILWEAYRPHLVAAISKFPPGEHAPELLRARDLINQQASVYVCQNFICKYPVTSPEEFRALLEAN